MVRKPEYIEKLEDGKLFSSVELNVPEEFQSFLDGRSLTTVHTDSWIDYETAKFNTRSKIYSTKQPFYLYLFKNDIQGKTLVIYYKEEQINELKLFIAQLLKTFKNGTTNNK